MPLFLDLISSVWEQSIVRKQKQLTATLLFTLEINNLSQWYSNCF